MPIEPQRCTAHSSRTGEPCKRWAPLGGTVCPTHGGSAPQVREAIRRRLGDEAQNSLTRIVELRDQRQDLPVALRAAIDLLDRDGWKPQDQLKLSGNQDEPLTIVIARPTADVPPQPD